MYPQEDLSITLTFSILRSDIAARTVPSVPPSNIVPSEAVANTAMSKTLATTIDPSVETASAIIANAVMAR